MRREYPFVSDGHGPNGGAVSSFTCHQLIERTSQGERGFQALSGASLDPSDDGPSRGISLNRSSGACIALEELTANTLRSFHLGDYRLLHARRASSEQLEKVHKTQDHTQRVELESPRSGYRQVVTRHVGFTERAPLSSISALFCSRLDALRPSYEPTRRDLRKAGKTSEVANSIRGLP